MLQSKTFQNKETLEKVKIVGEQGNFYNLSNGANIKKDTFFLKYGEELDVDSFFNNRTSVDILQMTEKLKNMDTSKIADVGGNIEPTIRQISSPSMNNEFSSQEYKNMLLDKYKQEQSRKDLSQYKVFEDDDEALSDFENKNSSQFQTNQQLNRQKNNQYHQFENKEELNNFNENGMNENVPKMENNPIFIKNTEEDESFKFFKSFKKIYPIKLSIDFDEKIADPNFIKLMAINYEGDIIKYYTKEFMKRIHNDPGFLENKIYEKLKSLIFQTDNEEEEIRKPKKFKKNVQKNSTDENAEN